MDTLDIPEVFGHTIFCDDIRYEIGGKRSYIGVYSTTLYIHSDFPALLPKFCFDVLYSQRHEKVLLDAVKILIFLPGDDENPSIEGEISADETKRMTELARANSTPIDLKNQPVTVMRGTFQFSPFVIQKPGPIKVRAVREGKLVRLGALSVMAAPKKTSDLSSVT